jgi:hydroxyacylglutathione hydrolase
MFTVHTVNAFNDNYIWLIQAEHSRATLIVDPGQAAPVLETVQHLDLTPVGILITHLHRDHIGGMKQLAETYDIPVFGPKSENLVHVTQSLDANKSFKPHTDFPEIEILATPGHTNGHISYLIEEALFCGDTLFAGGCGKLLGGTAKQLFHSLQGLKTLPDDTRIYCAHEYTMSNLAFAHAVEPDNATLRSRIAHTHTLRAESKPTVPSTMGLEKVTNPFLRTDQANIKKAVEHHANRFLETEQAVFTELRKWKDHFRLT